MKKLLGICIAFLLVFGTLAFGNIKEGVKEELKPLLDYAYSETASSDFEEGCYWADPADESIMLVAQVGTEDDYRWEAHRVKMGLYGTYYIEFSVRYYQDFTSAGSYGFEEWILLDYNLDGTIDVYVKRYHSVIRDYQGEEGLNIIIIPIYPEGFINEGWYSATKEELEEKYKAELEFWLELIKNRK
jgi:hypothetical protein